MNLGTTLEKYVEHKGVIEDTKIRLEEIDKEAKLITDATTQFWGIMV